MSTKKQTRRLFGTDGIRGKANEYPMLPDLMLRLGQALGLYFKKNYSKPRIAIGKDTRISGYMLEQALSSGICSVGVDTLFLGPVPTPGIAYLTRGLRTNAGVVISASHNSFQDNGVKIFSADGYKLPDHIELEIEEMVFAGVDPSALSLGDAVGRTRRVDDALGQYAVFLKEQFPKELSLDGLRIVLDCANGASYRVAPKVFKELGAEVFLVGVEPNGSNINDQCGALYPQKLAELVSLYKANIGFAFDGDADRLIVVDDKGEVLDGDEIMAICGLSYLERGLLKGNTVVATLMSNMGLELALKKKGASLLRTQVGDRYVVEQMRKGGYTLGGEQSGHLIFRDSSTTGDGILAALKLLAVMLEKGRSASELKLCMEKFPQVTQSVLVKEKVALEDLPEATKVLQSIEKKIGEKGRVLFRYSGTENKARLMLEGPHQDELKKMADHFIEVLAASITSYLKQKSK